jgi:hypothetical protein
MGVKDERDRLSQAGLLTWLNRDMQPSEMVTVYLSDDRDDHNRAIYCALIPTDQIEERLGYPTWDLRHGHGLPGTVQYREENETITEYLRFGDESGIEPLIIDRTFHGIRPDYEEISEEFRLFHGLYHDRKENHFIKIDRNGNEHLVATIEPKRIQIRPLEIRQFLAIKEMHLSIQFDCCEHSVSTLKELGLDEGGADSRGGLISWGLNYGDFRGIGGYQSFSRLLGKRLVPPLTKEKSGLWGFTVKEPEEYVEFIIGVDENADEITHTSNPNCLGNYFGANPGSPHYLTPVHFRKQVLDKYYRQPSKYTVGDGILWCGRLWCMYIDNDHDDRVCAWLGDLGRDLPYEEQLYWRSYNIPPAGGMSKMFVGRQLFCQSMDSERPEHAFQRYYDRLCVACDEVLGWRLLLPLVQEDAHCLQAIRIPPSNEQKDFDDLVLALTKVLIDSLNEKALNSLLEIEEREKLKGGIARLEALLVARGISAYEEHIEFLRNLQDLRSSGAAHRKGENYRKIAVEFGVDSRSLQTVFRGILRRALEVLDYLAGVVRSGYLAPPRDKADPPEGN